MKTRNFYPSAVGWVALATGVTDFLAGACLLLMYTVSPSFGAVNDVLNGLVGIASALLAGMVFAEFRAKSPSIGRMALALAIVGAIFSVVGSVLILYDFTGFFLAGLYSGLGNALIGVWLLAFCSSMTLDRQVPRRLLRFGMVAGAVMALGLIGIPGILAGIDSMEALPPYLYLALFGWLGTYILYPLWTLWLGRTLLAK